jgi:hypothetical protein
LKFPDGMIARVMLGRKLRALLLLGGALAGAADMVSAADFPPSLRWLPAERLSSGALALFTDEASTDAEVRNGVRRALPPATVQLDGRVGTNQIIGPELEALGAQRAQAEPHVARSPVNPDVLLATWQDGRFSSGGGARTCGYAVSTDGGLTWRRSIVPKLAQLDGGAFARATDPVAAFLPDGTMLLGNLALNGPTLEIGVLTLSISTNSGVSFEPPIEVYRSPSAGVFPDKNWMAVNQFPRSPNFGRIAITFTRFDASSAPICVVTSDDGGRTWTQPVFVTTTASLCQGSQPVFLPDGSLAVVYWRFGGGVPARAAQIEVAVSADGGGSFAAPTLVSMVPAEHNDTVARDGFFLPSAVGDANGNLFVAWQALAAQRPRVLTARSNDRGVTWTQPAIANDTPDAYSVFNPTLAVSPDGETVLVAYWDKRIGKGSGTLVDTFLAQSFDGGTNWLPNLRLTDRSTDLLLAPPGGTERMIGDYFGIAGSSSPDVPAVVVSIDTRTGNPDPLAVRVGVARGLTFRSWRAAGWSLGDILNPNVAVVESDADGDGVSLLEEYALGMDATRFDAPFLRLRPDASGNALLEFPRRSGMADSLGMVESSASVVGGFQLSNLTEAAVAEGPLPGQETVTMVVPAEEAARFFRLSPRLK